MIDIFAVTRCCLVTTKSLNYFEATRGKSYAEARDIILSDDAVAFRTNMLGTMALASTCAQQGTHRFRHMVVTSEDLPPAAQQHFKDLADRYPEMVLVPVPPDTDFRRPLRAKMAELVKSDRVCSFRIDDDDAVASGFLTQLTALALTVAPETVIRPVSGYQCVAAREGIFLREDPSKTGSVGPALVTGADKLRSIMEAGDHRKYEERFSVAHLETPGMWLRLIHGENDSRWARTQQMERTLQRAMTDAECETVLRTGFSAVQDRIAQIAARTELSAS